MMQMMALQTEEVQDQALQEGVGEAPHQGVGVVARPVAPASQQHEPLAAHRRQPQRPPLLPPPLSPQLPPLSSSLLPAWQLCRASLQP